MQQLPPNRQRLPRPDASGEEGLDHATTKDAKQDDLLLLVALARSLRRIIVAGREQRRRREVGGSTSKGLLFPCFSSCFVDLGSLFQLTTDPFDRLGTDTDGRVRLDHSVEQRRFFALHHGQAGERRAGGACVATSS